MTACSVVWGMRGGSKITLLIINFTTTFIKVINTPITFPSSFPCPHDSISVFVKRSWELAN